MLAARKFGPLSSTFATEVFLASVCGVAMFGMATPTPRANTARTKSFESSLVLFTFPPYFNSISRRNRRVNLLGHVVLGQIENECATGSAQRENTFRNLRRKPQHLNGRILQPFAGERPPGCSTIRRPVHLPILHYKRFEFLIRMITHRAHC